MNSDLIVSKAEQNIGYTFKDKNLLLEALTHSSYTNEMRINKRKHYERLEFLGDAVLQLTSSEFLFAKYAQFQEGTLSKRRAAIVCEPSLAACAREMGLGELIFLGKGASLSGINESTLADVVEAILGAIYLDAGIEEARNYVKRNIFDKLDEDELFVDNKSALQEFVAHLSEGALPEYEVVEVVGPEHNRTFTVEVSVLGKVLGKGSGRTKKEAQQKAARAAIEAIKKG